MAKYTELFSEYLANGGPLPSSSFALITDFEDIFKERYGGCEIGFETEALFALRLDAKARVVMPEYSARVNAIDAAMLKLQTPTKTRTEKRGYGAQHSETSNDGSVTDLPLNATTAKPAQTNHTEGSADINYREDNYTFTDYVTIDENLRIIEALEGKRRAMLEDCLQEFETLFMGVY